LTLKNHWVTNNATSAAHPNTFKVLWLEIIPLAVVTITYGAT
jgi:hypothetical protein